MTACQEVSASLALFHGRGDAASRGGGRGAALVRSAPPLAVHGELRVTEQGEAINDRYGLRPLALRCFEQSVSAVALVTAGEHGPEPVEARWREAMETLAQSSQACYRALVHGDPSFLEYFQHVTPVDVIERMQIGSRPFTRAAGGGVEALRSIPWIFAWSQSRHCCRAGSAAGQGSPRPPSAAGPRCPGTCMPGGRSSRCKH